MPFVKSFNIKRRDFVRAGEASINIQNILKSLNMDPKLIRRIAICGYEGEMNVVMHGGDGVLKLEIDTGKIVLDISDNGDGIEDIELAMQKGYSTATEEHREMGFGAGMGLPNMKANSDVLRIKSEKSNGAHVHMEFYVY
ncbi:MAG: anti-sigma regulatory factor [Desulfobacteraceae bacterium]|nr:MAG: anti-sigma regulatory factor [Desulfobacteraceae bacterium]